MKKRICKQTALVQFFGRLFLTFFTLPEFESRFGDICKQCRQTSDTQNPASDQDLQCLIIEISMLNTMKIKFPSKNS